MTAAVTRYRRILVVAVVGGALAWPTAAFAEPSSQSCWGQVTKVFAAMGEMGEHASGFDTPRLGLRNLARSLHDQGVIQDDTMQALGGFVADELGLAVDACQ